MQFRYSCHVGLCYFVLNLDRSPEICTRLETDFQGRAIYTMSLIISLCLVNQAIEKNYLRVQMCYFKYKYDCVVHFISVVSCPRQQKIQKTYVFICVVNEARTV